MQVERGGRAARAICRCLHRVERPGRVMFDTKTRERKMEQKVGRRLTDCRSRRGWLGRSERRDDCVLSCLWARVALMSDYARYACSFCSISRCNAREREERCRIDVQGVTQPDQSDLVAASETRLGKEKKTVKRSGIYLDCPPPLDPTHRRAFLAQFSVSTSLMYGEPPSCSGCLFGAIVGRTTSESLLVPS